VAAICIAPDERELHNPVRSVAEAGGLEVETKHSVASEHRARHAIR
ncbi:uncharacterized protein METZ01_LOCUS126594, partial [marine metagenome]